MGWSWGNIDWTATSVTGAAWVQALGALGAMYVVGQIDRKAVARLREDRATELERMRKEREDAVRLAAAFRLKAILNAALVFEPARQAFRGQTPNKGGRWLLPEPQQQRIRVAEFAINALLQQPAEVPPDLLGSVSLASHAMAHWRGRLEAEQPVVGVEAAERYAKLFRHAEAEMLATYMNARNNWRARWPIEYRDESNPWPISEAEVNALRPTF